MAIANEMIIIGYLQKKPLILENEAGKSILIRVRTIRRNVPVDADAKFEDVFLYYDGAGKPDMMDKLCKLDQDDIILAKGVVNIQPTHRVSECPYCGAQNIKYNSFMTYMYLLFVKKLDTFKSSKEEIKMTLEENLCKHYQEMSHQITLMGNVVSPPELFHLNDGTPACKYKLGVDRSVYIRTQDDLTADYPWVYSYGEQAVTDSQHLVSADKEKGVLGSLVYIKGFMHNRQSKIKQKCESCGHEYLFPATVTDIVPYNIEYLTGHKTDADIALEEELERRRILRGEA